ncbi:hypothetical protein SLS62_005792 [Diatrype stigma]|uniref:Peroxisomal membrane protein PEX14-like KPWE domain-containing protein n=1 Tax=Diatrype stigma TaxID=117547 RepID=A0AAN9V2B5_9PEZI
MTKTQLLEALHGYAPPDGPSLAEIALQARVRRFEEQTKVQVDAGSYAQWLTQTNGQPPRIVAEQTVVQEAMVVPDPAERRLAHLLVELGDELGTLSLQYRHEGPGPGSAGGAEPAPVVGRNEKEEENAASVPTWQAAAPRADLYVPKNASPGDPDKEPYPRKFEEIIEFLKTGKEIPGIRKIPDTVVEDPTITPQGRLRAPPKPWEVGRVPGTDDAPTLGAGDGGV